MARYFAHYWDGHMLLQDRCGSEQSGAYAALISAYDTAHMICVGRTSEEVERGRVEVVDDAGRSLFDVPLLEAIAAKKRTRR